MCQRRYGPPGTAKQSNSLDPRGGLGVKDQQMARDHGMVRSLRAFAGLAVSIAVLMPLAAGAQTAAPPNGATTDSGRLEALAHSLTDGISCTSGNPRDGLDERARKSSAAPADIGAALAIVSSSGDVCAPLRAAASAISADLLARQAAAFQAAQTLDATSNASTTSQARLANATLEAEARAASTRFSFGPPPRNLTRGRIAGL